MEKVQEQQFSKVPKENRGVTLTDNGNQNKKQGVILHQQPKTTS